MVPCLFVILLIYILHFIQRGNAAAVLGDYEGQQQQLYWFYLLGYYYYMYMCTQQTVCLSLLELLLLLSLSSSVHSRIYLLFIILYINLLYLFNCKYVYISLCTLYHLFLVLIIINIIILKKCIYFCTYHNSGNCHVFNNVKSYIQ